MGYLGSDEELLPEYPERMFNYVSEDGRVNFNLVIKHNSKEELMEFFASIAAKKFLGRKWKEVLKQLERTLKTELPRVETLLDMLSLRNMIIHEAAKPEVSNEALYDYFYAVQGFNEKLTSISNKASLT